MRAITATLGPFGLAAVVYLGIIFSRLSERLNAVAKKHDYRPWFNVFNGLIALAALSQAIRNAAALAPACAWPMLLEPTFALLTFHVPLTVGATGNLVLVWYYWQWILKEKP
jgi:hypothetical protein